jgi:hypothetical protein
MSIKLEVKRDKRQADWDGVRTVKKSGNADRAKDPTEYDRERTNIDRIQRRRKEMARDPTRIGELALDHGASSGLSSYARPGLVFVWRTRPRAHETV